MAGSKKTERRPTCSATLADGTTRCGSYEIDAGLCRFHLSQREQPVAPIAEEEPPDEAEALALVGIDPATWRSTLQSNLADNAPLVLRTLLHTIASATKGAKLTCPHCVKRFEANVRDHRAALDGIRLWNEIGFGKPKEDDASRRPMRKVIRFGGRELAGEDWQTAASGLGDEELESIVEGRVDVEVEAA